MNDTLTEVDQLSVFASQLDALLASIEDNSVRTVGIHLFTQLINSDHDHNSVDIAKLSAQTGLSRRVVKRALYELTLTGKVERLTGTNPRRYRLTKGA